MITVMGKKNVPHPGHTDRMIHVGTSDVTKPRKQRLLGAIDPTLATDPAALMRCSHYSTPLSRVESAAHAVIPSHIL